MEIAYFEHEQRKGIFNYYKVFGGAGKTKNDYQEVVNFLNDKPIISVEHNVPYDPAHPVYSGDMHPGFPVICPQFS